MNKTTYCLRFWNSANECVLVAGKYMHECETFEDAFEMANAFLKSAYKKGAVELDINNEFYDIVND